MFIIYILPITVEAIPWSTRTVASLLVTLAIYVKYLNFDLIINIEKKEMLREKKDM